MSEFLARLAAGAAGSAASSAALPRLPERFAPPDRNLADTSLPVNEESHKHAETPLPVSEESHKHAETSLPVNEESSTRPVNPGFETLASLTPQPAAAVALGLETLAPQPIDGVITPQVVASLAPPPTGADRPGLEALASLAPQPPTATLAPQSIVMPTTHKQAEAQVPDVLHVSIGRIDVRIPAAPPAPPQRPAAPRHNGPVPLSLADYLDGKRAQS